MYRSGLADRHQTGRAVREGLALKPPTPDPKFADLRLLIGDAPTVPPGFWGKVTFHYRDGASCFVEVTQTSGAKAPS